ncbi:hypothetical protein [Flavobacterium frigoris]|uniref:Transaldolase n=1 Tax=Flavobacterium frigoris (strain PS1) TaxID=1086011 RepID=H7FQZ8_FLAFP|nr:hypothetical protein [Flavobacterium frigoris]EIA09135.1 transaldolase [Flavobacterium frigoris PS1]
MKKLIIALSLLTVIACKKEAEINSEPGLLESRKTMKNINKATDAIKDYEKHTEELKKLKPIPKELYKQILSEKLDNFKRSSFNAGNTATVGLSSSDATYVDNSGKILKVSIFDGAGEAGSALIAITHMSLAADTESIDSTTTKKTEEIDGVKALTENDTNPDADRSSSITLIYKGRYQINLEGTKIQLDELKSYLKKFPFSKLD